MQSAAVEARGWRRQLWGVVVRSRPGSTPFLIGGGWHPDLQMPRYHAEPSRAVLFRTRGARLVPRAAQLVRAAVGRVPGLAIYAGAGA